MLNIALNCFLKLGLVGTASKMILSEGRFFCTRWKKRRFVCSPVLRRGGGCWWRRRGLPTGSWSSCSSSPAASCSSNTCSSLTPPSRPNVSGWSSSRRSIDGARLRCRCPTMELSTRKQQPGRPSGAYIHDIREGPGLTLQGEVLHQLFWLQRFRNQIYHHFEMYSSNAVKSTNKLLYAEKVEWLYQEMFYTLRERLRHSVWAKVSVEGDTLDQIIIKQNRILECTKGRGLLLDR